MRPADLSAHRRVPGAAVCPGLGLRLLSLRDSDWGLGTGSGSGCVLGTLSEKKTKVGLRLNLVPMTPPQVLPGR